MIKSSGKYILELSIKGKGADRIKSVQFYQGKLIDDKYFHKNLMPVNKVSNKKGEIVFQLRSGAFINNTLNIVAVAKTYTGLKLILQKPVKVSVKGI